MGYEVCRRHKIESADSHKYPEYDVKLLKLHKLLFFKKAIMVQIKSKKELLNSKSKIITTAVIALISLISIVLNLLIINQLMNLIKLQQVHFNTLYNQAKVLDLKVNNDESSRKELKEYYNIDYKKD